MVHATSVSFDEMRAKLHTLEWAREQLAASEPLTQTVVPTGEGWAWTIPEGWAGTAQQDVVPGAFVQTPGGSRFALTGQAIREAGAYVQPGIPRKVSAALPTTIFQDILAWAYRQGIGNKEFKILSSERPDAEPVALAMSRGSVNPFSNVGLLDRLTDRIHNHYGQDAEILVDYKFHHDLERSNVRLIVPGSSRVINDTRVDNDTWCAGISFANSLIGLSHPGTRVDGYLFRWWCTNGCTDVLNSDGKLARRTVSTEADAMNWAQQTVDSILGGLEHSFDAVQSMTGAVVPAGEIGLVLTELFNTYRITERARARITAAVEELPPPVTYYDLQNLITMSANADDVTPRERDDLLDLGGFAVRTGHQFCDNCQRPYPPGYLHTAGELTGAEVAD